MSFDMQKKQYLEALYKPDKSKQGKVDKKIVTLLDKINELKDYVTTSSCSGRVMIIVKDDLEKKHKVEWPFVTHDLAEVKNAWNILKETAENTNSKIWLKLEAPIIHIMARTTEKAQELIHIAQHSGFKYSGIIGIKPERIMIQILGGEKFETLVADNTEILLDEKYLEKLIIECNKKLITGHKKLQQFETEIKKMLNDELK